MIEEWKDIPGYEGSYQISSYGRIKSLDRYRIGKSGSQTFCKGRIMKLNKCPNGYLAVELCYKNCTKRFLVHRLVAIAFIDNPYDLPCVDHINGKRDDNILYNLRWCTHKENLNFEQARHNISRSNRLSSACKVHIQKLHEQLRRKVVAVFPNGEVREYDSVTDTEKDGFNHSAVSATCKGRYKTHKGCKFFYKDPADGN